MANLYEISQEIMDAVDFETGEILDPEALDALIMERDKKIENIALWIKNLTSDAAAYKAEKDAFAERQKQAENKAESLRKYLAGFLDGQKFSTEKVAISFRKSESVEITSEEGFIELAQKNGRDDLLTYKAPTPNKTKIKAALKEGLVIPGVAIVEKQNMSIK